MSSHVETIEFAGTDSLHAYIESRDEPDWALELRRAALAKFEEMSWPSTNDEEWRRSDISFYDFDSYTYAGAVESSGADVPENHARMSMEKWGGAAFSREAREKGVQLLPIDAFFRYADGDESVRDRLIAVMQRDLANIDHKIQAWHYASFNSGVVLTVPANVELAEPIFIEFRADGEKQMVAPHLLIMAGTSYSVRVVHTVTGSEDGEILYNEGTTIVLDDGAHVDYAAHHDLNIDSVVFTDGFAYLSRDAQLSHFLGAFGGMFAKHRTDVHLLGEGADARINGLYFAREDQHVDLRTVQYHRAGNSGSRTFYKGAVQDEARTVYQGLIEVAGGADKTDAYLTNNNLILNDGARADSIPSLRIQTDDVKCSHGSTTGKIDPSHLYYLETRGFSQGAARQLIVEGYFEEVAAKLEPSLAEAVRSVVRTRLVENEE